MKRLNLTGQSFGRLKVLSQAGKDARQAVLWNVQCLCGAEKTMRSDVIRSKSSIGCGCGRSVALSSDELIAVAGDYHDVSNRVEYTNWKLAVLALAKSCGHCGCKNNLVAHHIIPVRDNPQLLLDVSNGGVLCNACHRKFHGMYGVTGIGVTEWEKFTWK